MADKNINEEMEKKLDRLFSPVIPNSNYVSELQKRLVSKADVSVEYPNYLLILVVIGSGLALGLSLVAILSWIGRVLGGKKSQ